MAAGLWASVTDLRWLAGFSLFAVVGCTGPRVELAADVPVDVRSIPQVRTVEFPEDGQADGRAIIHLSGGKTLDLRCPRNPIRLRGSGPRDEQHWAQDGHRLWLPCGHQVVMVDLRSGTREVIYDANLGDGAIDAMRAGGGFVALSVNGLADLEEHPADHLQFAVIDEHGREFWSVTKESERPYEFDIYGKGRLLAFDYNLGVTLQPLDGGRPRRLDIAVARLAFVGRYLFTTSYCHVDGAHYELIDATSGERLGALDVPCRRRYSSR